MSEANLSDMWQSLTTSELEIQFRIIEGQASKLLAQGKWINEEVARLVILQKEIVSEVQSRGE